MDAAQKNKYYAGIAALAVVVIATIVVIVKRKNKSHHSEHKIKSKFKVTLMNIQI